jgi:ribosomal protein L22
MAATATPDKQRVRAQAKWVRTSARKARLVTDHIRGRSVPEARTVLAFTQRAAAREVEKVLASAVANAEANHGLVGDELVIASAVVDEGPTLKRWRARARGRVARIRKRTCHITLTLEPGDGVVTTKRRRAPVPATAPEPTPEAEPVVEETPAAEEQPKPKRTAKPRAEKADEKSKRATRKKKEE